ACIRDGIARVELVMTRSNHMPLERLLQHRLSVGSPTRLPAALFQPPRTLPTSDSTAVGFHEREQSLISFLESCSTPRDLSQVHARIVRTGFEQHVFVVGRLISFCSGSEQRGCMDYASAVFRQLNWPDGFLWSTMIRGFGRANRPAEAFLFYRRMREEGKNADNFTFSFLLKICGQLSAVELGKQVHCCVLKVGVDSHVFVCNSLIHTYALFDDVVAARQVFEESSERDVVSWNSLIAGYVHCGLHHEALKMFLRMLRSSFLGPDDATLVVILSACSRLGALDFGRWVHSIVGSSTHGCRLSVANSLIDMYAKCGAIDRAVEVFDDMTERDTVSWNSLILGLATHGRAAEAISLFERMRGCELEEPNDITFLGVLCACSHGGLVEEGRRYFDKMTRDYNISPGVRHYGCLVDILGRSGQVREAFQVIRNMPMECNAVVWRTLLGACRVHGDLELGQRVQEHLEEMEPYHSSDYMLLSHMYAKAGHWNDVFEVREAMRERGVQKPEPGNSSVNVLPNETYLRQQAMYH
ncbi:unnamed protein product, partial [Musa textilis]